MSCSVSSYHENRCEERRWRSSLSSLLAGGTEAAWRLFGKRKLIHFINCQTFFFPSVTFCHKTHFLSQELHQTERKCRAHFPFSRQPERSEARTASSRFRDMRETEWSISMPPFSLTHLLTVSWWITLSPPSLLLSAFLFLLVALILSTLALLCRLFLINREQSMQMRSCVLSHSFHVFLSQYRYRRNSRSRWSLQSWWVHDGRRTTVHPTR